MNSEPNTSAEIPEDGLICAFEFSGDGRNRGLNASEIAAAISNPSSVVWLHVNATHAGTLRWLTRSEWLPRTLRDAVEKHDERCRIEPGVEGLVFIMSDLTFEHDSDPSDVSTLWAYATDRFLLTARKHPLRTADRVRAEVRAGLRAESGTDLLEKLVGLRMEALHELVDEINEQVDEIEDQVLRGRVTEQRELLGRLRRDCARLRRSFTPERTALQKVLIHSQPALGERLVGWLRSISDDLAFLTEEVLALQERAKLLQEELAARVAEDTGQKLNALTALTAAFLPMTLISGIWGMNVAGLPGTEDTGAFAWVALLILAAGCITLGTLYLKKLF
ncbi:MAG TPA: CorA family divalent cation transporter [Burkholderiales bacterium]|nr:CorA family divalent cation transporter [Burkholderiales bacterium]